MIVRLTLVGEAARTHGSPRLGVAVGTAWEPTYELLTSEAERTGISIALADVAVRTYGKPLGGDLTSPALISLARRGGLVLDTLQFNGTGETRTVHAALETHTLCGIDLFCKDGPGWSRGGGVCGGRLQLVGCDRCATKIAERFSRVPIAGLGAVILRAAVEGFFPAGPGGADESDGEVARG